MGTTAEKLTYLNTTKQNLKTVINTTGAGLTNESTFRSYANVLNDKILGAINGDVDLFEEYPKVSGNGTDLSLNGVVEGKMAITPQGVSSQESTTGKNLLNVESDLEFTRSKTIQVNIPAGTYHITNNGTTASDGSNRVTIRFNTNNKTQNLSVNNNITVTLESNETKIYLFSHTDYPTGAGVSATIKDLMISVDGGTYEPYTGGVPAPNPDYPYPVKNVTGENSLIIRNENILNNLNYSLGNIDATGQDIPSGNMYRFNEYMPVNEQTTIYLLKRLVAVYYDENKEYISQTSSGSLTLTTPAGTKYARFRTFAGDFNTFNNTDFMVSLKPITSYVHHEEQNYQLSLGNIELNSTPDGTIRDYIYGTPDNWYKREYIGKVVLDGTESGWTLRGTDTNTYRFTNDTVIANALAKNNTSLYFCNEFKIYAGNSGIANVDDNGIALRDSLNGFTIRILKTLVTGLDTFKTWLSNHNTIGYYLLATPVDVLITDTTLITQLNNIYNNAHSYNGETNITTTYANGNEQMYLDIEALKNVWEVTE